MDILDILIAKKQSFTSQTETLVKKAKKAMSDANKVIENVSAIEDEVTSAQTAAQTALGLVEDAAQDIETIKSDITSAAESIVDARIAEFDSSYISSALVSDNDTSTAKSKNLTVTKGNETSTYVVEKNYRSTGENEDGSMTQLAITTALNIQKQDLENQIKKIPSGGGGGGTSFSPEDAGSIVVVGDNGSPEPSTITEEELIKTEIAAGTYYNDNIVGIEVDYNNKTFRRLQGSTSLNAGSDFNKYTAFGGRKRCIVNENGSIDRFLTSQDTASSLEDKRIMVYQPAFYYMRIPISITQISQGSRIDKEQIYICDEKMAGFKLHPAFIDASGNALKYILLPAFESSALRSSGEFVKDNAQNIDFSTDKLVSAVNSKPITGINQNFTISVANQMAENNGQGWSVTDFAYESLNQMLMIIEFGSFNMQENFNMGLTEQFSSYGNGLASLTGSTIELLNSSGRATNTTNGSAIFDADGKCSISYRGVENIYGNSWRFIKDLRVINSNYVINNNNLFLVPSSGWIKNYGYSEQADWAFLPIETGNGASSSLPVGDYIFTPNSNSTMLGIIGGASDSQNNAGPFYISIDKNPDSYKYPTVSACVMHKPIAGSIIENNNINKWRAA